MTGKDCNMPYNLAVARPKTKNALLTFRTTDECKRLVDALSQNGGVSQASVVERAVRELATREGLRQPDRTADTPAPYPGKASSGGGQE